MTKDLVRHRGAKTCSQNQKEKENEGLYRRRNRLKEIIDLHPLLLAW
jgi:hypothetical protein